MNAQLTEQQLKELAKKLLRSVFWNDFETHFGKSMWRMHHGSRSAIIKTTKEVWSHYASFQEVSDEEIEYALAELNGGLEIEWLCE